MKKKPIQLFLLCSVLAAPLIHHTAYADPSKANLYTVTKGTVSKTLYYTGTISPIKNVPVTSPTQGVVDQMDVIYGQIVKKNQVLMHIESHKIENNFRDARVAYLKALDAYNDKLDWTTSTEVLNAQDSLVKAKRTLNQSKNNYTENQKLYKLGIVSKQTLVQSKDSYADDETAYAQSQRSLKATLKKGQGDNLLMSKLALANAEAKYKSLKAQVDAHDIKSPAAGIVLKPATGSNNSNSNSKQSSGKLVVGSTVSYQEVLVNIGDMSGLKISFKIPEININQVKSGDTATVTGAGFPGITLNGKVTNIGAQASGGGDDGSLPTFPAIVHVKKLTASQKKWIRSGMDSQIAINVYKKDQQITVPVNAVHQSKNGSSYVMLYDSNTEKATKTLVTTGQVQTNNVQILSGLKSGDTVELPSKKS